MNASTSVYDDPEVQEAIPWFEAIKLSNANSRGQQRHTMEWDELEIIFQDELGPYITDDEDDVQEVMDRIARQADDVLRASGRLQT